jgi:hypothetical protein
MPTTPDWPLWYHVVKDFSGLIGTVLTGTVGFTGVMLTLRTNARNAEAVRQSDIAHERETLRVALRSELTVLCAELKLHLQTIDNLRQTTGTSTVPSQSSSYSLARVYNANLARLGLLSNDKVNAVVAAYSAYHDLSTMHQWLDKLEMQTGDKDFRQQLANLYRTTHSNTLSSAERALSLLQ